jgi:hypothetical protein
MLEGLLHQMQVTSNATDIGMNIPYTLELQGLLHPNHLVASNEL